jgi:hypothetical protein
VDNTNIPEWQVCQELGIELVSQVGRPKLWSSSDFLKEWGEFWMERAITNAAQPADKAQPDGQPRKPPALPQAAAARTEVGLRLAQNR